MIYLVTNNPEIFDNEYYQVITVKKSLELLNPLKIVGVDTETEGIDVHTKKLLLAQFGCFDFQVVVDCRTIDITNYKKLLEAGNYDMCYCEVRLGGDFDLSKLLTAGASLNYGAVSDTQLDELIAAYLSANDDDRKTACDNMCAYIANKAYIVPLIFERHQLVSHRGVVEGAKANENNPMCGIENWTVKIENVKKSEDTTKD